MLISVTSLIKDSWKIYKNNFWFFNKILLWYLVPACLPSITSIFVTNPFVIIPINTLLYLASFVAGLFISVMLIISIDSLLKNKPIDIKTAFDLSYPKTLPYLWVSILAGLAIFGGMLLFIIPGIIFAVWFSFSAIMAVLDNVHGGEALSVSKKIVKDNFWAVAWRWVAPYLFYGVISTAAITLVVYLISLIAFGQIDNLLIQNNIANLDLWWTNLISQIFSALVATPLAAVGVLLYNNLKEEKGGLPRK